jgi:citrate lyase subunit beta/citryl-CoA lyase
MIEKAAGLQADEVFLDLEDACAPSEKESARTTVIDALASIEFKAPSRAVRVNAIGTEWAERDIAEIVAAGRVDALIIPKVESAADVASVDAVLARVADELGRPVELELELQIESALGAINVREIVAASPRIAALVFGPGDYAASLGIPQEQLGGDDARYGGHQWHWIMSQIAAHARRTAPRR